MVDLVSHLNEVGGHAVLASFPGEIEGVDRNAVAPQTWPRIERLKAKGLGGSGVDDLSDVDSHAVREYLEFIDQRDIHRSVDILQELGHFGLPGRGDSHYGGYNRPVERLA